MDDNQKAFDAWKSKLPKELQNDSDYDLYGAYLSGLTPSENNHLPDSFKLPNHPSFSRESVYSNDETPGGEWVELGNGKWLFNATEHNVKAYGKDRLIEYFKQNEPDVELVLPDQYHSQ